MTARTSSDPSTEYRAVLPHRDKKREPEQDIAKGIGMLFVIFLHTITLFTLGGRDTETTGLVSIVVLALFGYMMPFYFIMSGYNYKPGVPYGVSVRKRAKQLLIPLFNFSVAIWVLLGAYLCLRGETDALTLFKSYIAYWLTDPLAGWVGLDASRTLVAQSVGPTWFIKCLMLAFLIFTALAPYALKKASSMFSVIVGLFGLSYIVVYCVDKLPGIDNLPWNADAAPAAAGLMLMGVVMRKYKLFDWQFTDKKKSIINSLIALGILIYLQVEIPGVGMFSSGRIAYKMGPVEVFVTLICGILGTVFLMNVSKLLVKAKYLGTFLAYVGQNSLVVLIIHGPIMRVFCDLFGLTGAPAGAVGLANLAVFVLTLLTSVFFVYLKGLLNKRMKKGRSS